MSRLSLGPLRRNAQEDVRYLSILDPGTYAAKALVIELRGASASILGRGWARHGNGVQGHHLDVDLDALKAACEGALRSAEDATEKVKGRKVVPDAAFMAVPSRWLCGALGSGGVKRLALERPISQDEYPAPLAHAGRRALRNLGRATDLGAWDLLDATLVTFSVNGNPVTDPVGFRGHSFAAMVFVSAARREALLALCKIADALELDPPQLVAEPLAWAAALSGDGLIIQVGANTTTLVLARAGVPLAFGSVALGGSAWTQALADAFHLSPARAEAVKQAYSAKQLSAKAESAVQRILAACLDEWLAAIFSELQSWDSSLALPSTIYLCGGASTLPDARDWVAKARWLDVLPFPHVPEVQLWDGSTASQVTDLAESRWQLDQVTSLALAAWAVRDRASQMPDGILRTWLEIK